MCECFCSAFICFIRLFNLFPFPFHLSLFLLLCIFNLCCEMRFGQFRYLLKSLFTFPPPFTLASITQCKHSISILIKCSGASERQREGKMNITKRASSHKECDAMRTQTHKRTHSTPFILRHRRISTNLSQSIWTHTLHAYPVTPETKSKYECKLNKNTFMISTVSVYFSVC